MNLIKNVFIPEKINNYYLFPDRIIGLDITKTDIFASQVYVKGKKITIEKFAMQPLHTSGSQREKIVAGLKEIMQQFGTYASAHLTLPSSVAIFKTLRLPFTDYEKIKLIIAYEMEPLVPFPISDAIIDFIITKKDEASKSAEVFVAAVPRAQIHEYLDMCNQAGVTVDLVTIDMIALYNLYKHFPDFTVATAGKALVLLDFGPYETRLAYLYDGQLKLIRTLSKGFLDQAKLVAKDMQIATGEALEHIMRFGLEKNSDYQIEESIKKNMGAFLQELSFTLNSFTMQTSAPTTINNILLLGEGATIKGLDAYITHQLHIQCEQMHTKELLHNPHIHMQHKNSGITPSYLISLGAAFASQEEHVFNLLPPELDTQDSSAIRNHVIIIALFAFSIIGALLAATLWQMRSFNHESVDSAQEVISELKTINGVKESAQEEEVGLEDRLSALIDKAETKVKQKQKVVSEFSTFNRESFLTYLYEFSKLDRDELGLTISELTITQDKVLFKGSVKNFAAATALRQALRESKILGTPLPPAELDKTTFSVQIPIKHTKARS